jgi:undecaprenyl-diphosphatase
VTANQTESVLPQEVAPHRSDNKILVLFLAVSITLTGLLWLASEVLEGDTFALDKAILTGLRTAANAAVPIGPAWLLSAVRDITALGGVTVLTLITLLVVGFLIAIRKHSTAIFVACAVASGALVSSGLKSIFVRPRPEIVPHLVQVTSASFPSGHAMNSAMVYLTLATLLARSQKDRRVRVYLIMIALVLTLMVGSSRVYLGVHWPSDVLAGWSIGALWAALCSAVGKALQKKRTIEPPSPASA